MPARHAKKTSPLYAEGTTVAVEKSVAEIRRLLEDHGAKDVKVGLTEGGGTVLFDLGRHKVKFDLVLPDRKDPRFRAPAVRGRSHEEARNRAWQAEERRLWRVLHGTLKMKFAAIGAGLLTADQEFLAHYVVPGGSGATVGSLVIPQLAAPESPVARTLRALETPAIALPASTLTSSVHETG